MLRRLLLAVFAAIVALIAWEWLTFPDVARLRDEFPRSTAFMEQRREELRRQGRNDAIDYRPVPYARISPYLRRAVLVAEDNSFYEHEGIDTNALREALEKDLARRKLSHGGSTITQQLAKNLYLSPSRNPVRKLREFFIARALEKKLTKKRILELYLNVVEMGERVYGAEAASRHYFGKPAAAVSPQQAALLAGCLPNPRLMTPSAPNKRLRWRQRMILSRMRRWGYVLERETLTGKKPIAAPPPEATATAPPPAGTISPPLTESSSTAEPPAEEPPEPEPVDEPPPTVTETTRTDTAPPPG